MNFSFFRGTQSEWDAWLLAVKQEEFLQSFEWGDFQSSQGNPVLRIQGKNEGKCVFQAQGFVHSLPLGMKYLYLPRIPKLEREDAKACFEFLKTQGFMFVRVEALEEIEDFGFPKEKTHHRQFQYTSLIDLKKSEEELLNSFHEKTRYNIRLASKKGIFLQEEKNIDIFWPLIKETYERDKIKSHSKEYYKAFIDLAHCTQINAYYEEYPLSSLLLYTFGKTSVYVHGASSNEYRNLMAPYLLQWGAFSYARSAGSEMYDLGGVAKPKKANCENAIQFHTYSWDKNDKLSGVTRFKAGFDGMIKHYSKAYDVIFHPFQYFFYKLARKFL